MEEQPIINIDPIAAFESMQQLHGMEMSRLGGELAKNAALIRHLTQENAALKERITALEQNATDDHAKTVLSGVDLSKTDLIPKAPLVLRKVKDAPQA